MTSLPTTTTSRPTAKGSHKRVHHSVPPPDWELSKWWDAHTHQQPIAAANDSPTSSDTSPVSSQRMKRRRATSPIASPKKKRVKVEVESDTDADTEAPQSEPPMGSIRDMLWADSENTEKDDDGDSSDSDSNLESEFLTPDDEVERKPVLLSPTLVTSRTRRAPADGLLVAPMRDVSPVPRVPSHSQAAIPLSQYFSQEHASFTFDTSQRTMAQFKRLVQEELHRRGLSEKDKERIKKGKYREFADAVARAFNIAFGTEVNLANLQKLCRHLRTAQIPDTLEECDKLIQQSHVNIFDFLDAELGGPPVRIFETETALSDYTLGSGDIFPRNNEVAGGLLQFLLRHIFNPRDSTSTSRRRQVKKRDRRRR